MSSIGFNVQDENDFLRFADQAMHEGEAISVKDGTYVRWSPGNGIELWAQLDQKSALIGVNPHYAGITSMRVGLTSRIARPKGSALDGAFHGWVDPVADWLAHLAGDSVAELPVMPGEYPIVFDCPDYRLADSVPLPSLVEVQLTAFAHELMAFESEDDFDAQQSQDMKLATESFLPTGLFADDKTLPEAYAIFAGHVVDTAIVTNPATRTEFAWATVRTLAAEVDVVCDPEVLEGHLTRGGIVKGTFWLSGRVRN